MNISATKSAIIAFSPIGLLAQEHGRKKTSMPAQSSNQMKNDAGLKRKKADYDCAQLREQITTACANQNKSVNKSASVNFGGFFNAYTSKIFKKGLEFASDNGALFASGFALFTATILRPAAILVTPGVKKENKEYACAKSISSSLIGFGIMAAVSSPIAKAVKKINSNPTKYLKESTIKTLSNGTDLVKSSQYKFSTQLFKLGADFASSIPKAILTCALIPPIMLFLFPKKSEKKQQYLQSQSICFKSGAITNRANEIFKNFIKEG